MSGDEIFALIVSVVIGCIGWKGRIGGWLFHKPLVRKKESQAVALMAPLFAAASAVLGHLGAITLPGMVGGLLGQPNLGATSSAAMMAVVAGVLFLVVGAFSVWRQSDGKSRLSSLAKAPLTPGPCSPPPVATAQPPL